MAVVDGGLGSEAESATGGELVGGSAAEGGAADAAAQDPHGLCVGAVVGRREVGELRERGEGGGARADDRGALARVPGPRDRIFQVRHAVRDPIGRGLLSEGRKAAAAGRTGSGPGAGNLDHRAGEQPLLAAARVGDVDDEGLLLSVSVHDPVPPRAGDTSDGGAERTCSPRTSASGWRYCSAQSRPEG